jgi:hypothetical protein
MDHEAAKLTSAAVLAVLMHTYLLRAKSDSAIADVSAVTAVLGAWLLARGLAAGWRGARRLAGPDPRGTRAGACVGIASSVATVTVYVVTMQYLEHTPGGDQARSFSQTLAAGNDVLENVERLRRMKAPYPDAGPGARYLFTCTAETDRVLISSGYKPELYYAAGRGFAAGRVYYLNSLAPAPEFKTFSLERLRAERVPIALLDPDDDEFRREFQQLDGFIREHYHPAGNVEFWGKRFEVLADSRIPRTRGWEDGLPCYR